jgi:hypothetical protein
MVFHSNMLLWYSRFVMPHGMTTQKKAALDIITEADKTIK